MVETVPFAKNSEGEWEGELPSGQATWGVKVFLIEEDVEKESFSHIQVYGIQPNSEHAAGASFVDGIRRDRLFGWIGENGLRQLVEDARGNLLDGCKRSETGHSQKDALLRLSHSDWALVDDSGEPLHLFKAPVEDDEGWV